MATSSTGISFISSGRSNSTNASAFVCGLSSASSADTTPRTVIGLHFDGASRGNPGEAAIGGVINFKGTPHSAHIDTTHKPLQYSAYIGHHTNNSAEYLAVLYGVYHIVERILPKMTDSVELHIYGDSELVIKQLRGEYRVRHPMLELYHKNLMRLFGHFIRVFAIHVGRSENSIADGLANRALDDEESLLLMANVTETGVAFGFVKRERAGDEEATAMAPVPVVASAVAVSQPTPVVPSPPPGRAEQMRRVQDEGLALFRRKNADYGDAFADYGPVGVIVRMGDKIRRLASIHSKGVTLVNDESIRDTLIDLHNYSAMAVMLLDEEREKDKERESETDATA